MGEWLMDLAFLSVPLFIILVLFVLPLACVVAGAVVLAKRPQKRWPGGVLLGVGVVWLAISLWLSFGG